MRIQIKATYLWNGVLLRGSGRAEHALQGWLSTVGSRWTWTGLAEALTFLALLRDEEHALAHWAEGAVDSLAGLLHDLLN